MLTLEDQAWEKACFDNFTDDPTPEQYYDALMELKEKISDEAEHYYEQDGDD